MRNYSNERVSTGIEGLDEVMLGGYIRQNAYLVTGQAGTGKTTLCLHFLEEGSRNGEPTLFVSFGEKAEQIMKNAKKLGMKLENVEFLDLSPSPDFFARAEMYDVFSPAEVEREPVVKSIVSKAEELAPKRVVVDSMTQLRYLSSDIFLFRKQVLSFIRFLTEGGATVLFTAEASGDAPDDDLRFLADGIIELSMDEIGSSVEVSKSRGSDYISGKHFYDIVDGKGMVVYPRLLPIETVAFAFERLSSGVPEIDELLGGGVERGTTTIISGPSGSGKTTLGMQFIKEAAGRGERSVVYTFEESVEKLIERSQSVNIPVKQMLERGTLEIVRVEPLVHTAYSFADMVKRDVKQNGTKLVMVDSVSGYRLAVRGVELEAHLHGLCRYLNNIGVTVLIPVEMKKITGDLQIAEENISYLADNVILLRYIEVRGELRRAIVFSRRGWGTLRKRCASSRLLDTV